MRVTKADERFDGRLDDLFRSCRKGRDDKTNLVPKGQSDSSEVVKERIDTPLVVDFLFKQRFTKWM